MSLQADSAQFVSEPVSMGKKGQKITLTFSVEGLPAGSNPVVGVFDKQGKIVGRTEWQSNTSSPSFDKKFTIMHANSTVLTFSVYNASDSVSKEDYLGGVTADLKNLCGNGGKNDVTEGGITFHMNCEVPKKAEKKKKEEKKVDPVAAAAARKKLIAKCDKEGGKKAQDIAGMKDMGGVAYFHVSIDQCEADWELLEACMVAMNKPCPEDADERRGGAEDIGKVLLSYVDSHICLYMHVPKSLPDCKIDEWFGAMTVGYEPVVISQDSEWIKAEIKQNIEKGVYPIKVKDDVINKGYQHLASKKLVMPDDDDEDELVFGDDDFYI
jgi:hypothetical protein